MLRGEIFDVAVDIRPDSASFGQWQGLVLSEQNGHQLWLPPGFAHGFGVLSEQADVSYKTSDCSWYEFATQIYRLVAPDQLSQLHRIISPFPGALAKRPTYSCLDMSLFQQCFNYQPPDWRVELAAIVNKLAN